MDVVNRAGFRPLDQKTLPPPLLQKSIRKTSEYEKQDDTNKRKQRFFKKEGSLKKIKENVFDNSQFTDIALSKEELQTALLDFQIRRPSPSIYDIEEEKSSNEHSKAVTRVVSKLVSAQASPNVNQNAIKVSQLDNIASDITYKMNFHSSRNLKIIPAK